MPNMCQASSPVQQGHHPGPPSYPYPAVARPHPCMGLAKYVAGNSYQVRLGKGYLAAHSSWDNSGPDTSCPHCAESRQTFEHAILSCPSTASPRTRLLQEVSDLAPEAPLWSDHQMLIGLAEFFCTILTGFPHGMPLLPPMLDRPSPDPLLPSPPTTALGP